MKVYLNIKDSEMIQLELNKNDISLINRKDSININDQSYYVINKSIFFNSKNKMEYIALHVEKI
jgi:hypothetical protein